MFERRGKGWTSLFDSVIVEFFYSSLASLFSILLHPPNRLNE